MRRFDTAPVWIEMRADPDGDRLLFVHARTRWQWWAALVLACGCGPASGQSDCDGAVVALFEVPAGEKIHEVQPQGEGALIVLEPDREDDVAGDLRVVRVEGCGAEPEQLAVRVETLRIPPAPELPWLLSFAADSTEQGTWVFDPSGTHPSRHVSAEPITGAVWIEGGVAVDRIDEADGEPDVVAISVSSDFEVSETVLVEEASLGATYGGIARSLAVLTTAGELRVLELATGEVESLRTGIASATMLDEDAKVIEATHADAPIGTHPFIIDRVHDTEIQLGRPEWTFMGALSMANTKFVFSAPPVEETQLILAPEGRELWLPGEWGGQTAMSPTGARLFLSDERLYRLDPDGEQPELVGEGRMYPHYADGSFFVHDYGALAYDASEPQLFRVRRGGALGPFVDLLEHDVYDAARIDEDSWAYLTNVDASLRGELRIRDLVTGEDEAVAHDVTEIEGRYEVPVDANVLFIASGTGGPGSRVRLVRL